jgi:hypothetical protein
MAENSDKLAQTKRLMGALLRMPPKHHDEMKLGRRKPPTAKKKSVSGSRKKR